MAPNEKDLPKEIIDRFDMDMAVLLCLYAQKEVAKAMDMEDSNLSNYLKKKKNRKLKVTQNILDKCYTAWGEKLREIYSKRIAVLEAGIPPESIVGEETQNYTGKEYSDREFVALQKDKERLWDSLTTSIKNTEMVVNTNHILAKLVEEKPKTDN